MWWLVERPGRGGRGQFTAVYRDLRGRQRSAGTFTIRRAANQAWTASTGAVVDRFG